MKKIWWCLWVLVFAFGCSEEPETIVQKEKISVSFDFQSKFEIKENDDSEIIIPIKLSASQENPVLVTYETIGQEVVNGSDFTILSNNPLTILAGALETFITIKINNNEVVQPEERNIYLRLRSVDQENVEITFPKEVIINIKEDDCLPEIPNIEIWIGALSLQGENEILTATGIENLSGLCSGTFNLTGKLLGSQNPESTVNIKLTQDPFLTTKGIAKIERTKLFTFTSQYEIEAAGNYDELSKKITLNYSIFDLSNGANDFSSTMVITAN